MPRAVLGGQVDISTRTAVESLKKFESDAKDYAQKIGRIKTPPPNKAEWNGFNQELAKTKTAATNSGMGMLMLSQTLDDAQYGLKGVVNNIAPLVMAMGGSSGLAGALTVATIGINMGMKAWESWTGSTATAEYAAKSMEAHQERLAAALRKAGDAGKAYGEFMSGLTAREEAGRASQDRFAAREERLLELKNQQALANAEFLSGQEKLMAEMKITQSAEMEAAQRELKLTRERKERDDESRKRLGEEIRDAKQELADLEKLGRSKAALGGALSPAESQRQSYLKEAVPGMEGRAKDLETRSGQLFQQIEDLMQRIEKELPAAHKAERTRQAARQAEELIAGAIDSIIGMLDAAEEAADAAIDAGKRAEAKAKEATKQGKRRRAEDASLRVETLRANGRNKEADRVEKEAFLESEKERLMEMGFSEADASAHAAQRVKNKTNAGRKRVHGAVSPNLRTGLNGDFHSAPFDFAGFQAGHGGDPRKQSAIPGLDALTRGTPKTDAARAAAERKANQQKGVNAAGNAAAEILNAVKGVASTMERISAQLLRQGNKIQGARAGS
jgi:hypothetical protein